MFNSIINAIRSIRPSNHIVANEITDLDQAYEEHARAMNELYDAERKAVHAEWNALTNTEQRDIIEWIDELNWRGDADSHRFYAYWKASRCD